MTGAEVLRSRLKEIDQIADEEWMVKLSERKKKELAFHDQDRDRAAIESMPQDTYDKFYGNRKYYTGTELSRAYLDRWIGSNARGKIFLDYACGNGGNAIKAAKAGAALAVGIDISSVSVLNARQDAMREGAGNNTFFVQADAEDTRLPDNCIDLMACTGMLHHLDLSCALPEMRRVLAPGGRILAVEALSYNPLIKLYRFATPNMRTDWEKRHILSLKDVKYARNFFDIGEVRYWHVTSILAPYFKGRLPWFNRLDNVLTKIPIVQLMAWIFTFELIKPAK